MREVRYLRKIFDLLLFEQNYRVVWLLDHRPNDMSDLHTVKTFTVKGKFINCNHNSNNQKSQSPFISTKEHQNVSMTLHDKLVEYLLIND